MIRFAKAQLASFIASAVDYLLTILLVEIFHFWYIAGSVSGTIVGALVNFSLGRYWVFNSERNKYDQLMRYFMVWTGYLLLTTSGVYLFTHFGGLNYVLSKLVVTLFLAVAYNYPLQKKFVYKPRRQLDGPANN